MSSRKSCWIALIRAIGPATHKKMSMAQLRDACSRAGFEEVQTVLATGNVIFFSDKPGSEIIKSLDDVLGNHGLENEVFLRQPKDLEAVLAANPFPAAAAARSNHMLVLFMSSAPSGSEIAAVGAYDGPERIAVKGNEAYIDYVNGVAGSRLTPARLEKLLGRPGTARNWNTVQRLAEKSAG